jgi:hypothetical protein
MSKAPYLVELAVDETLTPFGFPEPAHDPAVFGAFLLRQPSSHAFWSTDAKI